jgi:hypothetical protein
MFACIWLISCLELRCDTLLQTPTIFYISSCPVVDTLDSLLVSANAGNRTPLNLLFETRTSYSFLLHLCTYVALLRLAWVYSGACHLLIRLELAGQFSLLSLSPLSFFSPFFISYDVGQEL